MYITTFSFRKKAFRIGLCLFLAVLWGQTAQATHIRAGDIVARSLGNPLQWEFTLIIYTNSNPPNVLQDQATLFFGDGGSQTKTWIPGGYTEVEPGTYRNEYHFTHTYGAPGYYAVAFNAENRNAGILNMNASVQTSFYIQTDIFINPLLGPNNTPVLSVPPLDKAVQGQIFEHNPQAFDADGDSLSYRMIVPRMSLAGANAAPIPSPVANYTSPADPIHQGQIFGGGAPAIFTLDNVTGLITWNTPGRTGEYNIAFVIEEWRLIQHGQPRLKMSETTRDMQILVEEDPNKPPKVEVPKDLCVIPGTIIQDTITVSDPDGHAVKLELFSPLPVQPEAGANISFTRLGTSNRYVFRWDAPECTDIRGQAYQFVFKATDIPGEPMVPLTDFATWSIKVVGPPPTNVTAQPVNQTIQLNWDNYSCQNGDYIKIYRRENPYPFIPDSCELGVPAYTGYVKIAEVPITATSYTDANNLEECVNYSYILSVDFPLPAAGESYASNEAFTELKQTRPTLTKVSVETTDPNNGSIRVHWQNPLEFEPVSGNWLVHKTVVMRASGTTSPGPFTEVYSAWLLGPGADTVFVDTGLNTRDSVYFYKLDFYLQINQGMPITYLNSSDTASSVFLTGNGTSGSQTINLSWTYNTPWNNANNQHYIYREIDGIFELIDSVLVTGASGAYADAGTFQDQPLQEKETYCYYVVTQGDYACDTLPQNLLNNSQRICVFLEDKTAPCTPVLALEPVDCENFDLLPPYTNQLTWNLGSSPCDSSDIAYYTVFFTPASGQGLDSVYATQEQFYNHPNLLSLAGCYQVSVTDSSGNESPRSNLVCNDNCIFFGLPNIITPNGDNLNDLFQPSPKTRFVKSFAVTIFNRWGDEVYRNAQPDTFWNGTDSSGRRVPHGIYYYLAEVEFYTLDPGSARQTYKGWLEVIQ